MVWDARLWPRGRRHSRPSNDTEVNVARQPSRRGGAEEPEAPVEEPDATVDAYAEDEADGADDADAAADGEPAGRSARSDEFWAEVRVAPVEIALPKGVGYTLRAYRLSTEVAEPEVDRT